MPKTTKKYDTCSENNTFLPCCPRPNMWEKSEVTEHSLMIIQQLIFKLYGYWVFVIYVIKK